MRFASILRLRFRSLFLAQEGRGRSLTKNCVITWSGRWKKASRQA